MTVYLKELSVNDFLSYANDRINKSSKPYPYLNNDRLTLVFEWFCNKNLKCSGSKYNITANGEHFSNYINSEIQDKELMIDNLFHEVFCQAEWACRGLNDFYKSTVEQTYNKQFVKSLSIA